MGDGDGMRPIASDPSRIQRVQETQNQQGRQHQQNLQAEFRAQLDQKLEQAEETDEAANVDLHTDDDEAPEGGEPADDPPPDDEDEAVVEEDEGPEGLGRRIDLRG